MSRKAVVTFIYTCLIQEYCAEAIFWVDEAKHILAITKCHEKNKARTEDHDLFYLLYWFYQNENYPEIPMDKLKSNLSSAITTAKQGTNLKQLSNKEILKEGYIINFPKNVSVALYQITEKGIKLAQRDRKKNDIFLNSMLPSFNKLQRKNNQDNSSSSKNCILSAFDDCSPSASGYDRSPSAFEDRSPSAFDDHSPSAFDDRSPSAFDDRSPSAFDDCSPSASGYDHSPSASGYDHSPLIFDDRCPSIFDDCSPSTSGYEPFERESRNVTDSLLPTYNEDQGSDLNWEHSVYDGKSINTARICAVKVSGNQEITNLNISGIQKLPVIDCQNLAPLHCDAVVPQMDACIAGDETDLRFYSTESINNDFPVLNINDEDFSMEIDLSSTPIQGENMPAVLGIPSFPYGQDRDTLAIALCESGILGQWYQPATDSLNYIPMINDTLESHEDALM